MIHPPVPPESWAAEGARVAGSLEEVAAALVIGADPATAAVVARGIAAAQPGDRRVAIADLVGADDDASPGLLDCIRDGLAISDIARPLRDDGRLFLLPSGGADVATRLVLESSRWPRLVAGFRQVDALLLVVVRANAPGLPTLLSAMDGVVAVDLPPSVARAYPLLATVDRPEPELPPVAPIPERPVRRPGWRLRATRVRVVAGVGIVATLASGVNWYLDRRAEGVWRAATSVAAELPQGAQSGTAPGATPVAPNDADTITLGAIVNPGDSSRAASFTVELVAANTLAGANSGLAMRGADLPAPTLVPVLLGADGRPWYRALTGAWRDRAAAEALLRTLRERGLVRDDVGRVLRAPYALLLAEGVPPVQAATALAQWESRGIPAYALLQEDGSARLFAGAFETPGQSALVALSLRDAGTEPVLAFRTGRMF